MSKSQVNISYFEPKRSLSLLSLPVNSREVLENGSKLNSKQSYQNSKPKKSSSSLCFQVLPEKEVKVYKVLFPRDPKPPKCDHSNDLVLDRCLLTPNDHIDFLAQPKKLKSRPWPKWVARTIPPCTLHIDNIAQPSLPRVLNTFDQHLRHLSIFQIENFLNKIYKEPITPEEEVRLKKQAIRECRMRVQRQQKEMKKLHKKMIAKRLESFCGTVNSLRLYVLDDQPVEMTEEITKFSNVILRQICQLMQQKTPSRDSIDLVERGFIRIADKMGLKMKEFVNSSELQIVQSDDDDDSDGASALRFKLIPTECCDGYEDDADNANCDSDEGAGPICTPKEEEASLILDLINEILEINEAKCREMKCKAIMARLKNSEQNKLKLVEAEESKEQERAKKREETRHRMREESILAKETEMEEVRKAEKAKGGKGIKKGSKKSKANRTGSNNEIKNSEQNKLKLVEAKESNEQERAKKREETRHRIREESILAKETEMEEVRKAEKAKGGKGIKKGSKKSKADRTGSNNDESDSGSDSDETGSRKKKKAQWNVQWLDQSNK